MEDPVASVRHRRSDPRRRRWATSEARLPRGLRGQAGPLALEVGFGLGHSLMEMAAAHPDKNFVGVEVHKPGIGAALRRSRRDETSWEMVGSTASGS